MALPQGINFRASSGFVTDASPATYEIALSVNYPRTTPQGNTVGWESALGNTRDRTTGNDARLAGCAFDTIGGVVYRIDLPAAGNYNIRAAFGDASSVNATAWSLLDTSSVLAVLATGDNSAANSFKDATNTVRTAAAWPGSNAALPVTFTSTICRFRSDSTANNMIAHVYVEVAGGGATNTPVNPGAGVSRFIGFAPALARTANQVLSPGAGRTSMATFAPTVTISASQNINPAPAASAFTGFAPAISQPHAVPLGASATGFAGFAPSITQAINQAITPAARAAALATFAPTIAQSANRSASPGVGAAGVKGFAPTVTQTTVTPPTYSGTVIFRSFSTKPMRVVRLA